MMKDQYANYVVQKMLDVVDQDQRGLLIARIRPHLQSLKRFTYGRHLLLSKLKGILLGDWEIDFNFTEVEKLLQATGLGGLETDIDGVAGSGVCDTTVTKQ